MNSNGHVNGTNGHVLVCSSDYEERSAVIDVTPTAPRPGWRDQFPTFTHNLSWVDSDGCGHSFTLRSDSLVDLMADIKAMKALIKASKAQHQAQQPETQPEHVVCKIHGVEMERRVSKKTGGHYHCHRLAGSGNDLCFGREKKA